jgi:hypothetical protein
MFTIRSQSLIAYQGKIMFGWIKRASENAQRKNVERGIALLVEAANDADTRIAASGGAINSADAARVVSLQKSLLMDLIGPLSLATLRAECMDPVVARAGVSDGAKMALRHVFDTAQRNGTK